MPQDASPPAPPSSTASAPQQTRAGACADGILRVAEAGHLPPSADRATVRERAVTIDVERLRAMPDRLTLNLFDDACLVAVRRGGDVAGPVPVWNGSVEGVEGSQVTIVLNDNVVSGSVATPSQSFQIELVADAMHRVREVDASRYPNEHPPLTPPSPPKKKP